MAPAASNSPAAAGSTSANSTPAARAKLCNACGLVYSAELKMPGTLLRIRPEIFDFKPDLGLERGPTKPKIHGTVPTDRRTTIPNDSGSSRIKRVPSLHRPRPCQGITNKRKMKPKRPNNIEHRFKINQK